MKHALIRLTLYTAIALVPIGCGARKVATEITKNKTTQDSKTQESVHSEETNTSKATEAKTSVETNTIEGALTTNVKKYDKDSGKLIEERTTVSNKKKQSARNISETRYFEQTQYRMLNMERMITTHVMVKEYSKSKKSDTNNKPLYWMLFGVGTIGIVCYFAWKWLTSVKR